MESRPAAFELTPASSSASSPHSSASSSSLWDSYPLAHARTTRPVANMGFGRRPSMLASSMTVAPLEEGEDQELDFQMSEISDEPMEVLDSELQTRSMSGRTSGSRHSQSSSQGSVVNLHRQPSSPTVALEARTFNPLNPQSLQAPRRHRESSGESTGMQAESPTPMAVAQFRSPTPPLRPAAMGGAGTLTKARSSPSLLTASVLPPFVAPTTPPPIDRRRFGSVDDNHIDVSAFTASPGAFTGLSTSPTGRTGPIKRAVTSKRANLMPKPKAHLRVQMQLHDEGSTPFEVEVASEAALHRLARSAASSMSPKANLASSAPASLANRFPESIDGDGDARVLGTASSDSDDDGINSDLASRGDDVGSVVDEPIGPLADAEQEERRRQIQLWTGFRESRMGQSPTALTSGRGMDMDTFSPLGSGWGATTRSNKRKMAETDRFEPYSSMAFKRRAVSPTASVQGSSTPALGSPILGAFSSATITTPLQIDPPSPNNTGLGLYPRGPGSSRASSPAASATGSLSTSVPGNSVIAMSTAGRGALGMVLGARQSLPTLAAIANARDDEELSARAGDTLMSLG